MGTYQRRSKAEYTMLRRLREATGMSMKEAAQKLGVDRTTLNSWELGRFPPSRDYPFRLAKLYGCSIQDLGVTLPGKHFVSMEQRDTYFEAHKSVIYWVINEYRPLLKSIGAEYDDVYQTLAYRMLKCIEMHDPSSGSTSKNYIITSLRLEVLKYASDLMSHGMTGMNDIPWKERPKVITI